MPHPFRFLVVDGEPKAERDEHRDAFGLSPSDSFAATLRSLEPQARCDVVQPADEGAELPGPAGLADYDAVVVGGSSLHVYEGKPESVRQVALMRAVFASGTPCFGSCGGLQVAAVAAGGEVGPSPHGYEIGFARRIAPTEAGRACGLYEGRPPAFDAPGFRSDEVTRLPDGATLLASNAAARVQAAEIRHASGVFWGVQYHPHHSLLEIASVMRSKAETIVEHGYGLSRRELDAHLDLIEALHRDPARRDLAWRLGLDEEVTDYARRTRDLRAFIDRLVKPEAAQRGRG